MSLNMTAKLISSALMAAGLYIFLTARVAGTEFEKTMLANARESLKKAGLDQSLRERIQEILGELKPSAIREALRKKNDWIPPLLTLTTLAVSFLLFRSVLLAAPLAFLAALLPTWLNKLRSYDREEKDTLEIEAALSIITSSYQKSSDLIGAIEENIRYIKPPMQDLFLEFLFEYRNVTPSVQVCLANLKRKMSNKTARQWCDLASEAQNTATVKYAMLSTLSEFRTSREIQSEYNASLRQSMRDFRTIVLIIAAFIPGLYLYSKEWFMILVDTIPGKLSLSVLLVTMILGINRSVELQEPLSMTEDDRK